MERLYINYIYIIVVYILFVPLSLMYVPAGQNWILYPSRSPSRHPCSKAHILHHKPWWKDCWNRVHCSRMHSGLTQQLVHLHAMYARIILSWKVLACNDCRENHAICYPIHSLSTCVAIMWTLAQKHTHIYIIIILLYYYRVTCDNTIYTS